MLPPALPKASSGLKGSRRPPPAPTASAIEAKARLAEDIANLTTGQGREAYDALPQWAKDELQDLVDTKVSTGSLHDNTASNLPS